MRHLRETSDIEETLEYMQKDVFAAHLGTHKLGGELLGLYACVCRLNSPVKFLSC